MRVLLQNVFQQIVWLQLLVHKIEPSSCSRAHLLVTMKGVITRNDDSILNCKKTPWLYFCILTQHIFFNLKWLVNLDLHIAILVALNSILAITSDFTNSEMQISTFQKSFLFSLFNHCIEYLLLVRV